MKILLIHNYYRYRGGEDRYVNILEETLTRSNHGVIRFFTDSADIGNFSFLKKWRIPLDMFRAAKVNNNLSELIAAEKPDLAIVHNLSPLFSPAILQTLKQTGVPILKRLENYKFLCLNGLFLRNNFNVCEKCKQGNFLHGVVGRCYQKSFFHSLGMAAPEWYHRRKRTVIESTDLFLAASEFVKQKFVEAGFPEDKIEVRPNFIDFEPPAAPEPPGDYAVFVGRLSGEKGLFTLLKAFKDLPDIPLKILGRGPLEKELKHFVRDHEMNHVGFEGFVDGEKKREFISRARFMVFPSECYESFGYTIIESHALGVPVVASAIGAAAELMREGEGGLLFNTGDPEDLKEKAARMAAMNDQKLMEMKIKSLARVKELYTRDIGYKNLSELFEGLSHAARGPS